VRKVDLIVVMAEFDREGEGVEGGRRGERALLAGVILNLVTGPMPAHVSPLRLLLTVDEGLHTMVV